VQTRPLQRDDFSKISLALRENRPDKSRYSMEELSRAFFPFVFFFVPLFVDEFVYLGQKMAFSSRGK
jgi:hypothetical protein